MNDLEQVADEIKAILVEAEFSSRWTLVEAYHQVGQIITNNLPKFGEKEQFLHGVCKIIGREERTLYYCQAFYEMFPDLSLLNEGKNISWNKIKTKYLTAAGEKRECEHNWIEICQHCKIKKE